MKIHFDMETNDPDDMMTLCWLAANPNIELCGVTVMPGTPAQLGLVKKVLKHCGCSDIPIGSWKHEHEKECISAFHFDWLGKPEKSVTPNGLGFQIITTLLAQEPQLVILTGAPLKNFEPIATSISLNHWVTQGGFAGDNVVPEAYRLPKFMGRTTCPTFNFNGAPKTAMEMLENHKIKQRHLVSKNVCHGMIYNKEWHERVAPYKDKTAGLELIYKGMDLYLQKSREGKKFHDPLAAVVALEPSVCEFREVKMFRQKGEWGAELMEGTNTFISIRADLEMFFDVFLGK